MRQRTIAALGCVPALFTACIGGTALVGMVTVLPPPPAEAAPASCLPQIGPVGDGGGSHGEQDAAQLDDEQRGIAARIIQIGHDRQIPVRGLQVALQAGKTESSLRNLSHGDRDSLGIFQMRPSMGWGSPAELADVDYQVNKFYDTLLEVPGWEQMRPGVAAQKVERSGYPDRYHRWESLASVLLQQIGGEADPSGCSATPPSGEVAQRAIAFAQGQLGKPYVWGADGPDAWDCSSLMEGAYREAGVVLPPTSQPQFHAGLHVPLKQAQPGDLVFWGYGADPGAIHHVGMYLGNNEVLHAPQPGETVERTTIWDGGELIHTVTRPA